ncbi:MAG: Oligopeptide transport ATP-binding protein OppF [Pseudomonadales bacterium]|nr:Oligopeptide transport ATP-binding protein OppF [Pseudomonadales bacterium]
MSALLEVRGLSVLYPGARRAAPVRALDEVSLAIRAGSVCGLVGESGSGKSTLGQAIAGLVEPAHGQLLFDGQPLPRRRRRADFRRQARAIQMVFQDPGGSLNPRLTTGEILAEPLRLHPDAAPGAHAERVSAWLQRVGLRAEHAARYPHEFSGGQRQRIGIARALILEPRFVICDEPISALDVSVQAQIVNLLADLRRELDLTLLFIAHDLAMVRHVSDRIAVMYRGRLVEEGPAAALCRAPLHPYTQRLIAAMPLPDPCRERTRRHAPAPEAIADYTTDTPVGCLFAPRCPLADARCRHERPALRESGQDRRVACHHVTLP